MIARDRLKEIAQLATVEPAGAYEPGTSQRDI